MEVSLVVVNVHAAALEKEEELPPALMFQVVVFLELLVKMQRTRREEFLRDCVDVLEIEPELAVELSFLNGRGVDTVDRPIHEGFELVLDIVLKQFLGPASGLVQLLPQVPSVQVLHYIHRRLNVSVHEPLLDIVSPLPQPCLCVLKWDFHVASFVRTEICVPLEPTRDLVFLESVLFL